VYSGRVGQVRVHSSRCRAALRSANSRRSAAQLSADTAPRSRQEVRGCRRYRHCFKQFTDAAGETAVSGAPSLRGESRVYGCICSVLLLPRRAGTDARRPVFNYHVAAAPLFRPEEHPPAEHRDQSVWDDSLAAAAADALSNTRQRGRWPSIYKCCCCCCYWPATSIPTVAQRCTAGSRHVLRPSNVFCGLQAERSFCDK